MQIAHHLYLEGYITFPKTDSTCYPPNINLLDILKSHSENKEWGTYATKLLVGGFENPN